MRTLILALTLLTAPALACEWSAGAGAAHRYDDGYSGATAAVTCALDRGKWEISGQWFGEQSLYNDRLKIDAYAAVTGQRVFTWREDKFIRPFIAAGILLKESERCHDTWMTRKNGKRIRVFDPDCNRLIPEFWAILFSGGVGFGEQWRVTLLAHGSNWGVAFPNSGQDFLRVDYRF